MTATFPGTIDQWILEPASRTGVAVSSRARLARNLPGHVFAPRARREQLHEVAEQAAAALLRSAEFGGYGRFPLHGLSPMDRRFLRESHLISSEMEKGLEFREVLIDPAAAGSIMVNEEDHLRVQIMASGLRPREVYAAIERAERALEAEMDFAYDPQFGYLTACPTNTGTGLRVSVMLHLPGLAMVNQIEEATGGLGNLGLTVRGSYGEHSPHTGDLYQISNEVTLGKSEEGLIQMLSVAVERIIEKELKARDFLLRHSPVKYEDAVVRATALLANARTMDSAEASTLLSRVRLGIGHPFGPAISHERLNRLMIDVQPAHLIRRTSGGGDDRDAARAAYLREWFGGTAGATD